MLHAGCQFSEYAYLEVSIFAEAVGRSVCVCLFFMCLSSIFLKLSPTLCSFALSLFRALSLSLSLSLSLARSLSLALAGREREAKKGVGLGVGERETEP